MSDYLSVTADKCKLQADEDGAVLEIETDEGDSIRVNIQGCVFEFADSARWMYEYQREMESARALHRAGLGPNGEQLDDGGYEPTDPKHYSFHDVVSAEVDALRKREQEQRADHINPPGRRT